MQNKLIWVYQNGRMSPQLCHDAPDHKTIGMARVVANFNLTVDDLKLSFDELVAKYPAPSAVEAEVIPPSVPLLRQPGFPPV